MKRLPVLFALLLCAALPLRAQLDLSPAASFAQPVAHSYTIGLSSGSGTLVLHTSAEAWGTPAYGTGTMAWTKVFDPTDHSVTLQSGSVVTASTTAGRFYYTGGLFGPTLYDFQRTPPGYSEAFLAGNVELPAGILATAAGVYLSRTTGDSGGIDLLTNPASGTAALTFATSGPGQIAAGGGLALGTDGLLYAADSANQRIVRFNATTGAYVSDFAVRANTAWNTFAISSTGLLFTASFTDAGDPYGYIYQADTGTELGRFALPHDVGAPAGDGKPVLFVAGDILYATSGSGANLYIYDLAAIPEPSTCAMFAGLGALGLVMLRRRRLTA